MDAIALSQKDIAQALGIDPSVVTRDKAKGMPVDSVEAARAWRQQNVRPRVLPPLPGAGTERVAPAQAPRQGRGGSADQGEEEGDNYWASRARREQAEAELAELKLAEQRGQLVRVADIRAAYARRAAALRESLLQVPARLAPVLAAESDLARCHDTLQAELQQVLTQVTEA